MRPTRSSCRNLRNSCREYPDINLRLPTYGGLYAWEFGGREFKVRVEGHFVFNNTYRMLNAALVGYGLAYVRRTWRSRV
jgi:hypothetical protein